MKILKLIGIFAALVGAIFLALNWNSIFPDNKKKGDNWSSEDKIDITQKCNEIRSDWAKQTGWNADLYKNERDDIDQSKAMGLFSREGFNTVNNALRESATNKARDGYMAALKAQPFNEKDLKAQMAGITTLKEKEKMGEDPRISRIVAIDDLYDRVARFKASKHTITAQFDTDKRNWKSFNSLQAGILGTAKACRDNKLFGEIAHLPGFREALDDDMLRNVTNAQRENFFLSLSKQIRDYFDGQTPNDDRISLLQLIIEKYNDEVYPKDYGLEDLTDFQARYNKTE